MDAKGIIEKIVIRFTVLVLLFIGLNALYTHFWYQKDLQNHAKFLTYIREVEDHAEILYIGESSNHTFWDGDQDKGKISDFIARDFPYKNWAAFSEGALHGEVYKNALRCIPEDAPLETVIVTLNLRSFSAGWIHSWLESNLQKHQVFMRPYPPIVNRFLLSFKDYPIKTREEWLALKNAQLTHDPIDLREGFQYKTAAEWAKAVAQAGIKGEDGKRDWQLTQFARKYVQDFAFNIDLETHPRIADFDAITALAQQRNWNLIFLITGENIEQITEMLGDDLPLIMQKNRDVLVERYTGFGVTVVDNLDKVPARFFRDKEWPTEHYKEEGRKILANNLSLALQQFYPDEYVGGEGKTDPSTTLFFNDCEGGTKWPGMKSLSDTKAFSGKQSSKFGQQNPFSLTFEKELSEIPDSVQKITFSCMLYLESTHSQPKFSVEGWIGKKAVYKKRKKLSWNREAIGRWQRVNYTFVIPEELKKGEKLKVYLYDSGEYLLYVDDLRVQFL